MGAKDKKPSGHAASHHADARRAAQQTHAADAPHPPRAKHVAATHHAQHSGELEKVAFRISSQRALASICRQEQKISHSEKTMQDSGAIQDPKTAQDHPKLHAHAGEPPASPRQTPTGPVCLVTGGSGRLGRYVLAALLDRGYRVRVLQRHSEKPRVYPDEVEIVPGDITDRASLERAVEGIEYVFHLAGLVSHSAPTEALMGSNYHGTLNLLEACRKKAYALKRFVYVSTISVYGPAPAELPADEDTPTNPADYYGRSKLMAEETVKKYGNKMPFTILRIAVMYGDGFDEAYLPVLSALEKGKMKLVGGGDNIVPFVHAGDVARALILAANSEQAVGRTYVISSSERRTQRHVLTLAAHELGVRPPTANASPFFLKLGIKLARFFGSFTGKKTKLREEDVDRLSANRYFSTARAESELNFRAEIPLEDGIRQMVAYYRAKTGGSR